MLHPLPAFNIPEKVPNLYRSIRNAGDNMIANWPREVYEGDFHKPPLVPIVYVMQDDAVREVAYDTGAKYIQADVTLRIIRPVWRNGLAAVKGEAWRWQRKAMAPVFAPRAMEDVIAPAQNVASALVKKWAAQSASFGLVSDVVDATSGVVFDTFLSGLGSDDERHKFSNAAASLMGEMSRTNWADILQTPEWTRRFMGPSLQAESEALHSIVRTILARAKDGKVTNLLDRLRSAKDVSNVAMSDELVADNIVGMLAAGRETTAMSIAWSLWLLAQHPEIYAQVHNELSHANLENELDPAAIERLPYLKQVLFEAMRLYPPGAFIARQAVKECQLGPHKIRKGGLVLVPIYALHRRAEHWEEPDRFNPDRFAENMPSLRDRRGHYLPFGGGPRVCMGMAFALCEAMTVLATILRRGKVMADESEAKVELKVGSFLAPRNDLRIRFEANA